MFTSSESQFNDYNKTILQYPTELARYICTPNAIVHYSPILTSSMARAQISYGQSSRHYQMILSSSDFDSFCSRTTFIAALFSFNCCWNALHLVKNSDIFSGRCCSVSFASLSASVSSLLQISCNICLCFLAFSNSAVTCFLLRFCSSVIFFLHPDEHGIATLQKLQICLCVTTVRASILHISTSLLIEKPLTKVYLSV